MTNKTDSTAAGRHSRNPLMTLPKRSTLQDRDIKARMTSAKLNAHPSARLKVTDFAVSGKRSLRSSDTGRRRVREIPRSP